MIIGIDGNEANVKKKVGINVYAFQILKHLYQKSKIKNQKHKSNIKKKFIIYLKTFPLDDLPKETSWWQYRVLKPQFLWTQWRLPLGLFLTPKKPDIFFTPSHYAPRFSPVPIVISIMDLAFLRFPDQFKKDDLYQLVNWTKYSVKKASHIFTISEFTKKDIVRFYNFPAGRITVTYPGVDDLKSQISNLPPASLRQPALPCKAWLTGEALRAGKTTAQNLKLKYQMDNDYLLYIGTLQPRKNLIRLIKAYNILIRQLADPNIQLVIVGKKGWMYEEIFKEVEKFGLKNKVIFTGFISEEEKQVLLKNALAFVLPSLYEGFGLPVLEAMQAGCPVVVSDNSSLPEVAGKAAIYIEKPESIDSIHKALVKMVKLEEREKRELINKGYDQVKKFSWEKCAQNILEVLLNF